MSSSKKMVDDAQTEVNSPLKRTHLAFSNDTGCKGPIHLEQVHTQPNSQTQKAFLQRELVKQIVFRGKQKTIRHQIGKIDKNTALYAKPRTFIANQFKFDSIPPRNHYYYSLGSAKISQISKGLKTRSNTILMKNQHRYSSNNQSNNLQEKEYCEPRIQVSGLVTYKFSSVNAQRSLCSGKIDYEQKLKQDLKRSNISSKCMGNRFKKILMKHSGKRYQEHVRKQNKMMSNLDSSTDDYLKKIHEDNKNEMLLYGEKAKKLNFIKDYMSNQNTNYSQGRHIIDEIVRCRNSRNQRDPRKRAIKTEKNQADEDQQFQRRRIPRMNKKIHIKTLTFVE